MSIAATDDANLSSGAPYRLQSFLQFGFESTPQLRGYDGTISVRTLDHRGVSQFYQTVGDYDFSFNNTWFNTSSNIWANPENSSTGWQPSCRRLCCWNFLQWQ